MNVDYLPTLKQVVEQHKIWNEVVFLVYPIYVRQCLHAIVDTIIRKSQRFWYFNPFTAKGSLFDE